LIKKPIGLDLLREFLKVARPKSGMHFKIVARAVIDGDIFTADEVTQLTDRLNITKKTLREWSEGQPATVATRALFFKYLTEELDKKYGRH